MRRDRRRGPGDGPLSPDAGEVIAVSTAQTTPPPLLAAESLSKSYGDVQVLHDVDLAVDEQEVIGLAGENGAGKSTLLNILSGVLKPDGGRRSLARQVSAHEVDFVRIDEELINRAIDVLDALKAGGVKAVSANPAPAALSPRSSAKHPEQPNISKAASSFIRRHRNPLLSRYRRR